MTALAPTSAPPRRAVEVSSAAMLDAILEPDVHVCLWERAPLPRWVEIVRARSAELDVRAEIDVARPEALVLALAGLPPGPLRDGLLADATALVPVFARLARRSRVYLRVQTVTTDSCRKFHRDRIGLRLLCTYAGPGTEWIDEEHARTENLGRVDVDIERANGLVVPDPTRVRHAPAGAVILLKGDAWPGNAGRGAIHRSPPIEASGARRLVLQIDEAPPGI